MMSDEETGAGETDSQFLAEFKDGKLQIVEVTPLMKNDKTPDQSESYILSDEMPESTVAVPETEQDGQKFMQVLNNDGMMQLDLLNLTLVKCGEGEDSYRLVARSDVTPDDVTVTCVLQSDDNEETDESYVVMEGEAGPIVILQSAPPAPAPAPRAKKPILSPVEILEKAKALQKASRLLVSRKTRGRRRAGQLPSPRELLASPNFKLYLYSCKACNFKCNAVKELTRHRAEEHGGGSGGKYRVGGGPASYQCARCPYRAHTHAQLAKHVSEQHSETYELTSEELEKSLSTAEVLVCGACGFECDDRRAFADHVRHRHNPA